MSYQMSQESKLFKEIKPQEKLHFFFFKEMEMEAENACSLTHMP